MCSIISWAMFFSAFADTVEIRNGMKTTYADKPRKILSTLNGNYDYKWALDKKGNWKLYIRNLSGRLIDLSNTWVSIQRTIKYADGTTKTVTDYYYFDFYENMVTGWYVDVDSNVYFLNTDDKETGRLSRGWTKIGNDYYYFDALGVLQRNIITEDGFYVNGEGRWE